MLKLRVRSPESTNTLTIAASSSLASLKREIELLTEIKPSYQAILLGYPPKSLENSQALDATSLSALGVKSGETIIVTKLSLETISSAPVAPAPTAKAKDNISGTYVEVKGSNPGFLVLRVVKDDNSCLFHSIALVLESSRSDPVPYLRSLVSKTILADPTTWSEAVLGLPPTQYAQKMQASSDTWGGAIELSIFSTHYEVEICSIDVATGRIDRFGEERGYENRIVLVYSGIHYDALTFSYSLPINDTTEFDTKIFSSNAEEILVAAKELVSILKKQHYYTDAANFSLRCSICRAAIVGEKEARSHAMETQHQSFVEYSEE